jgi:DNA-binding LytR/AlgR family response regulator
LKIRTVEDPSAADDEIVIRYRYKTEKILYIEEFLRRVMDEKSEVTLRIRDTEYFIPTPDILYFETEDGKVKAHTKERIFTADVKLFEIPERLGDRFVRVSKCCVVNIERIEALSRNITGAGEIFFGGCEKKAYVSRAYYNPLKEKLNKMRFM